MYEIRQWVTVVAVRWMGTVWGVNRINVENPLECRGAFIFYGLCGVRVDLNSDENRNIHTINK